ncbi:MAG: glycosyl transferase [Acidobacteria bacterium]|nr:glycosyl transferase [Acidobacteriota bacterium]
MSERIPRIFHFVFGLRPQDRPFPPMYWLGLESCRHVNRPQRILLHYQHEPYGPYWDLIRPHLELHPVEPVRLVTDFVYSDPHVARYRYAHSADFVRLDALVAHGGVYADMDTLFVRPLPEALYQKPFVIGREQDVADGPGQAPRPSLCNALLMAEPGAAFARHWREAMETVFDGTWSRHSTGLPWQLSQIHPSMVHLEPEQTFFPYMWTREDLHRLLEAAEEAPDGACSIHLWAHLWESRGRRDFSDFHAGLISESRIRRLDSTYNRIARRFLPPPSRARALRYTLLDLVARVKRRARRLREIRLRRRDPGPGSTP